MLVVKPYDAAFLRFAHDVADCLVFRKVEVVVCLDAAAVGVGRHGVPYAAFLQLGETHLELARAFFEGGVYNELVDCAISIRGRITLASLLGDWKIFLYALSGCGEWMQMNG